MAVITHRKVSTKADVADSSLIRPSNWNDTHVIVNTVTTISNTYSVLTTDDTIKCIGSGSYTITLHTAVGYSGEVRNIKHMGTGTITVVGLSGQLIDLDTSLIILPGTVGRYPCPNLQSDGTGWLII